jgi:hypothetical protein
MPRPGLPPTPGSSTDLRAKDNARVSSFEMAFTLPPPAIASAGSNASSNDSVKSDSSYHPASPSPASPGVRATANKHRRALSNQRQESAATNNAEFSLPPPPTRSRKIIQMKPGPSTTPLGGSPTGPTGAEKRRGGSAGTTPTGKKQPSATSVAGKKIARKTAHSLIERRRRSKMNEEFGVLKDIIPACRNQEMHKLAILQASIDYLRYLEQCVADLKAANSSITISAIHQSQAPTPRPSSSNSPTNDADSDDDLDEDLEMQDTQPIEQSPSLAPILSRESLNHSYGSTNTSPAILPSRHGTHNSSYTSISSLPSPAFSSYQQSYHDLYRTSYTHSADISPALLPSVADHEATAALLMLNTDRRHSSNAGTGARGGGRGMSVQDLLSA